MSGASLQIDLDTVEIAAEVRELVAGMANSVQLMREVGAQLLSITKDRFADQVGPDGTPWTPSERARRENGQTLVRTSRLKRSLSRAAGPGVAKVGTNVVYAAIHQFGGKAGRGGSVELPARPYLGIGDRDRPAIEDVISSHIARFAA